MSLVLPKPITVSVPTGRSQLPIVELDRSTVLADRKRIRMRKGSKKRAAANCSFGEFQEHLEVDAWPLFHAAKKTELATTFTTDDVDRRALCFAQEHAGLFHWNTGNLRRVDRNLFALEDHAESGLAGRFGAAVAYLTMIRKHYVFWDRISVLWDRAAKKSRITHPERVKLA